MAVNSYRAIASSRSASGKHSECNGLRTTTEICSFCSKPLAIEHAKTDADGKAVHEECYFQQLRLKRI